MLTRVMSQPVEVDVIITLVSRRHAVIPFMSVLWTAPPWIQHDSALVSLSFCGLSHMLDLIFISCQPFLNKEKDVKADRMKMTTSRIQTLTVEDNNPGSWNPWTYSPARARRSGRGEPGENRSQDRPGSSSFPMRPDKRARLEK